MIQIHSSKIACLVVLLNSGASPNFDEIEFEMAHEREGIQTAFGRLAYSTALHCLFGNICCLRPHTDSDALRPQAYKHSTIIILSGYRPSHSMSGSAPYFNKSENVFTSNPINRDMSKNTLKKRCQYSILKSCQRKMDRILKLPLPMSLKNEILDGFILNVV
jgi:hypothetical protein